MRFDRLLFILAMLAMAVMAAAQAGSKQLAVVNGEVITEEQISKLVERDLENLQLRQLQFEAGYRRDRHEIMERTLDSLVQEKLLAAEAAKRKIKKEELVQAEIENKVEVPKDEAVKSFYEANKPRIEATGDEALQQVRQYLMQQKRNEIREAFIEKLKRDYSVVSSLEPLRIEVAASGHPTLGPASAPITIVEFSDFECPYCGSFFSTLKEIEKNYGDKTRIVYRQFPLNSIHPHAQKAAEASLCANDQQHFWEFHDVLFGNQHELTVDALKTKAVTLKLDATAFNSCLDSGKQAEAVRKDLIDGVRAGVTGTPAIFINGRMLSGAQPYGDIRKIIEDELARAKAAK